MIKRNQPSGYSSPLSGKLDALAAELRTLVAERERQISNGALVGAFAQARQATRDLRQATLVTRQAMLAIAKPLAGTTGPNRAPSACPGGICPAGSTQAGAGSSFAGVKTDSAGGSSGLGGTLAGGLGAAMKAALTGDFQRALQSMLSSIARSIASGIGKAVGGGLGGSLASTLVGTGLSLLIGKLFHKRQSVQVENTVKSEVLNFPRLLGLDFATNPASRLFGERAVARGPAFTVEVNYKGGAEDIVTAKIASRLVDLNLQHGIT